MPPKAVKTINDFIYWQYVKLISESAGFGKKNYRFTMSRFTKLKSGEIIWSSSIREWIRENEMRDICGYCGSKDKNLTVEHILPSSRGGPDHPDNTIWVCKEPNLKKSNNLIFSPKFIFILISDLVIVLFILKYGYRQELIHQILISIIIMNLE